MEFLLFLAALSGLAYVVYRLVGRCTVFEYERGLKFSRGRLSGVLEPGEYWFSPLWVMIEKLDVRPVFISVAGQEVLSADGVTLKVSIAANYQVADAKKAWMSTRSYQESLYLELQTALRQIISGADIDTVMENRGEISAQLQSAVEPKAEELGLKLLSVSIKDIMFPGKLKEIFAQVVNARKQAQASMEAVRGEAAAMRSLANTAKLVEKNPALLQLRMLQTVGESSGNSLVMGLPQGVVVQPDSTANGEPASG